MEKSGTPQGQDQTAKKTDKPQDGGALGNRLPPEGQKPPPPPEHNNPDDHSGQAPWWKRLEVWKFIGEMVLVVIGIYLACVYSGQLTQMIESNKINRESLTSVQRAFVTFQQINLDTIPLNLRFLA